MNAFKYLNTLYGFIAMAFNNEIITNNELVKKSNNNPNPCLDLEADGGYLKEKYDIESDGGISRNYAILFRMMNEERIAIGF